MLISDYVRKNANLYPDKTALIDGDKRFTFSEFNQRVNGLARAVLNLGLRKGDRLAVLSENIYQYVELYFSCAKSGIALVPLNFRFNEQELAYVVKDSDAQVIFFESKYQGTVTQLKNQCSTVRDLVSMDQEISGFLFQGALIDSSDSEEPDIEILEDDIVILGYTGGTTGLPKGVMTTHKNLISSCFHSAIGSGLKSESIYLNVAPLFHAGDAMAMFACYFAGGTNVFSKTFNPQEVLETIERHQVTHTLLVPIMILVIINTPEFGNYNLQSMQCVMYGTAPMPMPLLEKAIRLFKCDFLQVYGATETFVPISFLYPEDHDLGGPPEVIRRMSSVGREVIGVETKIVDDKDHELPAGEVGEIIVRGNNVMKGYWKLPDLTDQTLSGGWYHTGDMGKKDQDGYIFIVDRKKDMIISGGENIYPKEIENVLFRHPSVQEASVIGVPDEQWGEAVKALVVKKPDIEVTEVELLEYCKQELAGYKKPRSIDFVENFPRSAAGKVLKYEIRAQYWNDRERKV